MSELKDVADYINHEGLPDPESMRADIEENNKTQVENSINQKLDEYRNLYDRFKKGEELSEEETQRMAGLSKELEVLAGQN